MNRAVLIKIQQNIGQYFLFGTFFKKYRQKYRGSFNFKYRVPVPAGTFNKVPSTGTAGTLKKYRAHLWSVPTKRQQIKNLTRFS